MGWEEPVQTSLSCLSERQQHYSHKLIQSSPDSLDHYWDSLCMLMEAWVDKPHGSDANPSRSAGWHQWARESPAHLRSAQIPGVFQKLITIITRWHPSIHPSFSAKGVPAGEGKDPHTYTHTNYSTHKLTDGYIRCRSVQTHMRVYAILFHSV